MGLAGLGAGCGLAARCAGLGLSSWEAVAIRALCGDGASQLAQLRHGQGPLWSRDSIVTRPQEEEAQGYAYLQQLHLQGTACFRHAAILSGGSSGSRPRC